MYLLVQETQAPALALALAGALAPALSNDIQSYIASFLSGYVGTLEQQLTKLKAEAGYFGPYKPFIDPGNKLCYISTNLFIT